MLRATPVMVFWTLVSSCRSHSSAATGLRDCSSGMGGHQFSPLSGFGAVSYSSSDEETSGSVSGSSTSSSAPASPGAVVFRQHRSAGIESCAGYTRPLGLVLAVSHDAPIVQYVARTWADIQSLKVRPLGWPLRL